MKVYETFKSAASLVYCSSVRILFRCKSPVVGITRRLFQLHVVSYNSTSVCGKQLLINTKLLICYSPPRFNAVATLFLSESVVIVSPIIIVVVQQ